VLARYRGLADRAVDAVLARVSLADRAGDRFSTYSLGMKQRLGVAAALLGDPPLLILDEPTNGLDPAGVSDMRRLLRSLAESGQTVLLSSHLLSEVQELCDRVGVISGGRLVTESTVDSLRGGGRLLVRASPVDRALAICLRLAGDSVSIVDSCTILLPVDPSRAAEINRVLVTEGIAVYEIRPSERSLEEVFFDLVEVA
jgi:ABC-2 type transport system ATP-binding protein